MNLLNGLAILVYYTISKKTTENLLFNQEKTLKRNITLCLLKARMR